MSNLTIGQCARLQMIKIEYNTVKYNRLVCTFSDQHIFK